MYLLKSLAESVVRLISASSGIGRTTALQFVRRGASVVVAARNQQGLKSLVEVIGQIKRRDGKNA